MKLLAIVLGTALVASSQARFLQGGDATATPVDTTPVDNSTAPTDTTSTPTETPTNTTTTPVEVTPIVEMDYPTYDC